MRELAAGGAVGATGLLVCIAAPRLRRLGIMVPPGGPADPERALYARLADECFAWLDAPVRRVASTDTFVGYAPQLEDAILPQVETFRRAYEEIVKF